MAMDIARTEPLLLDSREAARALRVSVRKLFDLRKEGLPYILVGKSVRYMKSALEAWAQERLQCEGVCCAGE